MAIDPAKNDVIWRRACNKEMATWQSPATIKATLGIPTTAAAQDTSAYYRVPVPGEPVTVSGMRRRPELNGAHGEVVSSKLDEHGRVVVRVYDSTIPGYGGSSRTMKIQPFRLVPSSSSPALRGPGAAEDDRSSVLTCSRPGSLAGSNAAAPRASVGAGGRALGSAISVSARSALSSSRAGKEIRAGTPAGSSLGKSASHMNLRMDDGDRLDGITE
mmetsp:Transcript_54716/g.153972  ORF Transcript_54716/g.153972 Transcript_54716/m.153972 type:complete len:216 (-) Transcript_54716:239-886(-)